MRILCNFSETIKFKSIIDYHVNKQYSFLPSWGERSFRGIIKGREPADACVSVPLLNRLSPLGPLFLAWVFLSCGIAGLRLAC